MTALSPGFTTLLNTVFAYQRTKTYFDAAFAGALSKIFFTIH